MASKRKVPNPRAPIDPEHQAGRILANFAAWLAANPTRRITLACDGPVRGFRVHLDEQRATQSATLQDSCAQAAQVVGFDGAE